MIFIIRFADERFPYYSMVDMMFRVLDHLNDMRDSVFLLGAEQPFLPLNFPFPAFSNRYRNIDILI